MDSSSTSDVELSSSSSASSEIAGVGLSDPQDAASQRRRRMLDLVNRLHSTGYDANLLCAYVSQTLCLIVSKPKSSFL
jgi:hypothetical protein